MRSHRQLSRQEGAAKLTQIRRALWWIALLVPVALLAMVSADGISGSDIGVVVIPSALAEKVAEDGSNTDLRDAFSRDMVLSGKYSVEQAFPLKPELNAEVEELKKAHA